MFCNFQLMQHISRIFILSILLLAFHSLSSPNSCSLYSTDTSLLLHLYRCFVLFCRRKFRLCNSSFFYVNAKNAHARFHEQARLFTISTFCKSFAQLWLLLEPNVVIRSLDLRDSSIRFIFILFIWLLLRTYRFFILRKNCTKTPLKEYASFCFRFHSSSDFILFLLVDIFCWNVIVTDFVRWW